MDEAFTIDDVIFKLDKIIEWSLDNNSRVGYFATLYRRMTIAVKQGIANNSFQDGKRMEQLDVMFAGRYFEAWNAYSNGQPCSKAWTLAFDSCNNDQLICLQHLLLGINTHINLDLCIATAACCPGDKIYDIESDFNKINEVIATQSQAVQDALCKVWFPLQALTNIANNKEKAVLNFSIDTARTCSWANAIALAHCTGQVNHKLVSEIDNMVVGIGNKIMNPGLWMNFLIKPVRWMESKDVGKIIELLKE